MKLAYINHAEAVSVLGLSTALLLPQGAENSQMNQAAMEALKSLLDSSLRPSNFLGSGTCEPLAGRFLISINSL